MPESSVNRSFRPARPVGQGQALRVEIRGAGLAEGDYVLRVTAIGDARPEAEYFFRIARR